MQRTELVAVGIAQIGEIERTEAALANARWFLDRLPSGGDARLMPGVDLLRTVERETDRRAVAVTGRLPVDRRADHEHRAAARVREPTFLVRAAGLGADGGEERIVESARPLKIVRSDHHMAEHALSSFNRSPPSGCFRRRASGRSPG